MDYFEAFERGLYALIQVVGFGFGALILVAISGLIGVAIAHFMPEDGEGRDE